MKLSRDQIRAAAVIVVVCVGFFLLFRWLEKMHWYEPSHEPIGIVLSLCLLVIAYSEKRKNSLGYIALGLMGMVVLIHVALDSVLDVGILVVRRKDRVVLNVVSLLIGGLGIGAILHSWMLGSLLHRQPGLDLAPESPANADSPSRPQPPVRNPKRLRTVTILLGFVPGVGLALFFSNITGDMFLFALSAFLFGAFFKLRREGDSRKTAVLIMAVSALLCAVISVLMDIPDMFGGYPRVRPLLNAARTMIIGLGIGAMVNEQLCGIVTARRRGTIKLAVKPSQS